MWKKEKEQICFMHDRQIIINSIYVVKDTRAEQKRKTLLLFSYSKRCHSKLFLRAEHGILGGKDLFTFNTLYDFGANNINQFLFKSKVPEQQVY